MLLVKEELPIKKEEGDKCTPKGKFKLKYIFYRKDRVKIKSRLKTIPIKKDFGWCDDIRSKKYNKFVKLPFKYKAEKLYKSNNIYDIIVVINYNINPTKKNKGSAIFMHVAKKKLFSYIRMYCCLQKKNNIIDIVASITKKSYITIS